MKKTYITPTSELYRIAYRTQMLANSGNVSDQLDPASPTDPPEGETMSAKSNLFDFESDSNW